MPGTGKTAAWRNSQPGDNVDDKNDSEANKNTDLRNRALHKLHIGANWRIRTIERSVLSGDAALCQSTWTNCLFFVALLFCCLTDCHRRRDF